MGRRAEDREAVDFRKRKERAHDNKWLKVAKGEDKEASSKPVVVIGTHGSIALNGTAEKAASGSWSKQVKSLLAIESIDMIIVDETSQVSYSGGQCCLIKPSQQSLPRALLSCGLGTACRCSRRCPR